jgi:tetratricopeptide (TPR) repeat protein
MSALAEAMAGARSCRLAGDLSRAEQIYREVLRTDAGLVDAWYQLGEVSRLQGKVAEAEASYRRAIQLDPDHVEGHAALGGIVAARGQRQEAIACYRHVLRNQPDHIEALTRLGITLGEGGQHDDAIGLFRRVLQLQPGNAQLHHNLGVALAQRNQLDEAVASLEQALRLKPDYVEAYNNLAITLGDTGRHEEAVAHLNRALQIRPDYADGLINLGRELGELGRKAEAVVYLRQAARLKAQSAQAHNILGLALADLGRFSEAEAAYEAALRLEPKNADVLTNLGSAYKEQGRLDEALACYEMALWFEPDAASIHWNRALARLQMGDYERGWPEYEWRWRRRNTVARPFTQPRWDGAPLCGRTILLYSEQGLGDTLQFVRYAALVRERGGTVVLECPGMLRPLLSSCPGVDRIVAEGAAPPAFDVQIPLLSLPAVFGTTVATVPARIPYLAADPALAERWGSELRHYPGYKIGIAWQGNPNHRWDRHRSFALRRAGPLARLEGVRLISLQQVHGLDQLDNCGGLPIVRLGDDLDGGAGAFMGAAAIMAHLDLVITVDSALAHLAGALGVPTWTVLAGIADWRWMVDRDDTPWYPTMRLFRQPEVGRWEPVFERMAAEITSRIARANAAGAPAPPSR